MTIEGQLRELIAEVVRDELAKRQSASDYLSVAEAAELARVSPYTIRRWVRHGALTRHTAGARLLVRRDELERHLACKVVPIDINLSVEERAQRRFR